MTTLDIIDLSIEDIKRYREDRLKLHSVLDTLLDLELVYISPLRKKIEEEIKNIDYIVAIWYGAKYGKNETN